MITDISTSYVDATFPATVTRTVSVIADADCWVKNIFLDSGDGLRPFQPFQGTNNGEDIVFPFLLTAGPHTFYLTGEKFDGVRLMIIGVDMQAISEIELNASIMGASHTEYAGVPLDSQGTNGDTHWDTNTAALGGQIRYQKITGSWRQV